MHRKSSGARSRYALNGHPRRKFAAPGSRPMFHQGCELSFSLVANRSGEWRSHRIRTDSPIELPTSLCHSRDNEIDYSYDVIIRQGVLPAANLHRICLWRFKVNPNQFSISKELWFELAATKNSLSKCLALCWRMRLEYSPIFAAPLKRTTQRQFERTLTLYEVCWTGAAAYVLPG